MRNWEKGHAWIHFKKLVHLEKKPGLNEMNGHLMMCW